jgi:DtxR family Mn-dependent transcriptional regulator
MTAPLSRSVEDYLKAIFLLSERGAAASTTDIARELALSPAAVTGMVKRLADSGYLEHEPYRGVLLTATGRAAALAVMRRHRILETYLAERLRYDWASVHAEAERLEHAASDELVERMAEALGEPKYDPHGAPIPTRDGEIESPPYQSLAEVEVGVPVTLRQVGDDDPERLRYLEALGLVPAAALVVTDRQPFGGPITVRVGGPGGSERSIGIELAATLRVGPASP